MSVKGLEKIEQALADWRAASAWKAEVGWFETTPPDVLEAVWRLETRYIGGGPAHWYTGATASMQEYESWAILHNTHLAAQDPSSGHYFPKVVQFFASQGLRGQALMERVAQYYKELLTANLEQVAYPPLRETTVEKKRLEHAPRPEKVWYEWGSAKEFIDGRVVPNE